MAKPEILLLGTYHFDNPNLDAFNMATDDVLTDKRQSEIQAVADCLASFKPTKIAVEQPADNSDRINQLYTKYREDASKGITTERRSELVQIGFRLANMLNHEQLYPIDVKQDMAFEALMAYAASNGHEDFLAHVQNVGQSVVQTFAEKQAKSTVGELLRWFNEPEMLALNHSFYLDMLKIGKAPDYVGVQVMVDWYARNLKIFNELTKIADEDSRILVIFGQGHIPIIRQTILDCSYMTLADPLTYLP
jgi:hypothetical protein